MDLSELLVADAAEWRTWLRSNHSTSQGVWLVLAKKGTTQPDNALLRRRARRGDLLWLDRWAARASRQRNVPATIHAQKGSEPVVSTQRHHRGEVEHLRPNASIRGSRGSPGKSRWTMEFRLRRTSRHGSSRGPGKRPGGQSPCFIDVSQAHKCEQVLHPLSNRKRKEDRDPSETHRAVRRDAGPGRDCPPARSTIA